MKARIPADIDMADRILAGLTARQLAILGGHGLLLWALWAAIGERVPTQLFGAAAVPVAALGLVWATTKVEGTTLERLGAAALRSLRPRRRVLAPEGIPEPPASLRALASPVAAVDAPVRAVAESGCVDLGADGSAVVSRASSLNFALRSEAEQRALVEGFGRLLNALDAPAQFLVRSDRADLRQVIDRLDREAGSLPHRALEEAAREHAEFLRALAGRRDVLAREVLVCFRDTRGPDEAAARLGHRTEEAAALLRGLGIRLVRLEREQALCLAARVFDGEGRPPNASEASGVVEGRW